ncbi:MAG: inositol 2-dehydrogenase [Anaerolineae bacterium]|nr:inositol 2-dehydrogenase [Anaerolineae bacterium]
MTTQSLTLGVIGAGRIGRLHAQHLVQRIPQTRVLMVADVVEAAAQATAQSLGIPHVSTDPLAVVQHPNIQAVVICSSTDTHADLIEAAAGAGKHIFCEKPIALSLPTIDGALAAVERARVKLQIGFNRRFDANFRRVRQAVVNGEVGQPHTLRIISRDPAPPPIEYVKVSGGLFLDMTIHDFDMARYLVGAEVEAVYTQAGVMVDPAIGEAGDVDTAVVTLRFANGVLGTIENSRRAVYGYDQRVEVFGSGGAIRTDNDYPNNALLSDAHSVRRDLPLHFFMERYTASFVNEINAFVDAIVNDRPAPVTGVDGRAPVVMGLAARRSYDEGRPVRLAEVEAQPTPRG